MVQDLYEEMDDLKFWIGKMRRKSWNQLLKVKLFDIGISYAISNADLSQIYGYLTDELLKLP
jgi:hypothetical protein